MNEMHNAELYSKKLVPNSDEPAGRALLGDSFAGAFQKLKDHPVEVACGTMLAAAAGAGALMLFKGAAVEKIAEIGFKQTALVDGAEGMANGLSFLSGLGQRVVSKILPASENASVKAPFVLRNSSMVPQAGAQPELVGLSKPLRLSFDQLPSVRVPAGHTAIPSFS